MFCRSRRLGFYSVLARLPSPVRGHRTVELDQGCPCTTLLNQLKVVRKRENIGCFEDPSPFFFTPSF